MAIAVEEVPVVSPGITFGFEHQDLFPDEVEIDVTYADIANGVKRSTQYCPVARAVGRRFDGASVGVGAHHVQVSTDSIDDHLEQICAGYEANGLTEFVNAFDGSRTVPAPTTLTLRRVY